MSRTGYFKGESGKLFDSQPPFRYLDGMHDLLLEQGYLSLFFLSFLASTLIPLGSSGCWCL